ncbi:MAG TPA: Rieske 2Fe-2S domain-containing protein, partial [Kofleriaceae bacterium]
MAESNWIDVGAADVLERTSVQEITLGKTRIALTHHDGSFGAISGICNHAAGPLGQGNLQGDYIVCPWHYWKFHRQTGEGEPGFEDDKVPAYAVKVEAGRVLIDIASVTRRNKKPHAPHPLARPVVRQPGPIRVAGISTTMMHAEHPRYSTSDELLQTALDHAASVGCETQFLRLRDLRFRACEGYYS